MLGLTNLGVVHTAVGIAALIYGFWALFRYKEITLRDRLGQTYVITTLITAVTGLFIFRHGGFGPPHVLSILTLIALLIGAIAALSGTFGRASRVVQAVAFTTTFLFHMIPGFTETLTRLPATHAQFPSAEAPGFKPIYGTLFVLYAIGLVLQLRWIRKQAAH